MKRDQSWHLDDHCFFLTHVGCTKEWTQLLLPSHVLFQLTVAPALQARQLASRLTNVQAKKSMRSTIPNHQLQASAPSKRWSLSMTSLGPWKVLHSDGSQEHFPGWGFPPLNHMLDSLRMQPSELSSCGCNPGIPLSLFVRRFDCWGRNQVVPI